MVEKSLSLTALEGSFLQGTSSGTQTTAFRKGVKVTKLPSKRKTAKEIMAWHRRLKVDPSTKRFHGYGNLHNWTHISLLWELPYAEALMLPHNIDLMHQERNVAESIISMCFG